MVENVLIEFDKSGAEWVVVAYLSGDGNMLAVVDSGESPHTITGTMISGLSKEVVELESSVVGLSTDPGYIEDMRQDIHGLEIAHFLPRTMSIKQCGKKSNHGLNYDMRYRKFALINEVEEGEAKNIVTLYREVAYPGVPIWHEAVQRELRKNRTLTNCFGRKRHFMDAWGPSLFDAAYAFKPQSTVFDICREGFVKTYNDNTVEFRPAQIVAHTHDSNTYQYPTHDIPAMASFCRKVAEEYMSPLCEYNGREFRIKTTMKMGSDWGNMHSFECTEESIKQTLDKINEQKAA